MSKRALLGLLVLSLLLALWSSRIAWQASRRDTLRIVGVNLLSLTRSLVKTAELLPPQHRRKALEEIWQQDLSPYDDTELFLPPTAEPGSRVLSVVLIDEQDQVLLLEMGKEQRLEASSFSPTLKGKIRVRVPLTSVEAILQSQVLPWAGLVLFFSGVMFPTSLWLFWRHQQRLKLASLRELTAGLQKAREKEATQIARELHDDLGQILSLLKMELSRKDLPEMQKLNQDALDSLRRIVRGLRPVMLDREGLYAALEWKGREIEKETEVVMVLRLAEPEPNLSAETRFTLFRIFQELVTNSLKHARPQTITVSLRTIEGRVQLVVEDDGPGFEERPSTPGNNGLGLLGLRERVRELAGEVRLESIPGARVSVWIPL
ncbi:MAG: sensor histidine kinase [Candidatus Eremiobacteraeota bacterium]|nr:sensor histidine kinase [Candidatus Eremiobacteraeota bacterium]